MTFDKAAWAIDGARSGAKQARIATYATGGAVSGIVKGSDLRVITLATPGNGVRIMPGSAMVLNRYLGNSPNEAYVVANPTNHVVPASSMPAASGSQRHYLVCIVVGDPAYNQTGHPYMPSTPLTPEQALEYEYVRPVIVPCTASTRTVEELNLPYPAYALARLDVPANTTTIQSSMIVDLRRLSQARTERTPLMNVPPPGVVVNGAAVYGDFSTWTPTITVPPWANRIDVVAQLGGVVAFDSINGDVRVVAGSLNGADAAFDIDAGPSGARVNFMALAGGAVTPGANIILRFQARRTAHTGRLEMAPGAQLLFDVQFSEYVV